MKKHKNKDGDQDQYQQGYGAPSSHHSSHGNSGMMDQLGNFFKK